MLTGYTTNLPTDTLFGTGVLFRGQTVLGVTDGAPDFDPGVELSDIAFDQKPSRLKGTIRRTQFAPVIKGVIKEFGPSASGGQIGVLEPDSSEATAGGVTTTTPKAADVLMSSGAYVTDLRWVFERASGGYAAIYFPLAHVRKWTKKGQDKKEAQISFEIVAVGDPVNDLGTGPYAIEIRTQLPSSGAVLFRYNAGDSLAAATVSRATTGRYYDVNGVVQSAATNVMRDAHHPFVTPDARTTLLEAQRTNGATHSVIAAANGWGYDGLSETTGQASPDAGTGATKLTEDVSAGIRLFTNTFTVSVTAPYSGGATVSMYCKAPTAGRYIAIQAIDSTGAFVTMAFDVTGVALGTVSSGGGATYVASSGFIHAIGSTGWYRVGFTMNPNSTATTIRAEGFLSNALANPTPSYTGDGTSNVTVWGYQIELGNYATSIIPTAGSTVTRSVDGLSFPAVSASAATLFTRAYDLATRAWVDTATAYSGGAIVPAVDKAYSTIAILSGTLTAAQCATFLGVP